MDILDTIVNKAKSFWRNITSAGDNHHSQDQNIQGTGDGRGGGGGGVPHLYSNRKRHIELEVTDDEDEGSQSQPHHSNFSKWFRTDMEGRRIPTRGSGMAPEIPGISRQPWEFNFDFGKTNKGKSSKPQNGQASGSVGCSNFFGRGRGASSSKSSSRPVPVECITIEDDEEVDRGRTNEEVKSNGPTSASSSKKNSKNPSQDQEDANKTDNYSNLRFTFTKPARQEDEVNVEVITLPDDDNGPGPSSRLNRSPCKTAKFREAGGADRRKMEELKIQKATLKQHDHKTSGFMKAIKNVGKILVPVPVSSSSSRGTVDPLNSTINLEERDQYKRLLSTMCTDVTKLTNRFRKGPLTRSKANETDMQVLYRNWSDASPTIAFNRNFGNGLMNSRFSRPSLNMTERVKQDLHLFSTPSLSRSSGSSPIGPNSPPPPLVDIEEEEKDRRANSSALVLRTPSIHSTPAAHSKNLALSTSYADLNHALNSTRLNLEEDEDEDSREIVPSTTESSEEETDITILSESILRKGQLHRQNSLALEQNLTPYVRREWLDGVTSTWRENQERINAEVEENLLAVDTLRRRSTLQKDLSKAIEEKLKITNIIELEPERPQLPDITEEMLQIIMMAKRPGRDGDVLGKVNNNEFTRGDVKTLAPSKWLNDNVINCFLDLIVERSRDNANLPKTYAFSTFFYPKLLKEGYSPALKRWTRKVDLFAHDLVVFPIHLGMHWCLAAADLRKKTVKYYDSLGGHNDRCLNTLLTYLSSEKKERKGEILDKMEWSLENVRETPQQLNGSDCGVFTCKCAEYLSRDEDLTYSQENMNYYRDRMVYEIIKKDLLYP